MENKKLILRKKYLKKINNILYKKYYTVNLTFKIKNFIKIPTKKKYFSLIRLFHPDKANKIKNLLMKSLIVLPEDIINIIWSFYYDEDLMNTMCMYFSNYWNENKAIIGKCEYGTDIIFRY